MRGPGGKKQWQKHAKNAIAQPDCSAKDKIARHQPKTADPSLHIGDGPAHPRARGAGWSQTVHEKTWRVSQTVQPNCRTGVHQLPTFCACCAACPHALRTGPRVSTQAAFSSASATCGFARGASVALVTDVGPGATGGCAALGRGVAVLRRGAWRAPPGHVAEPSNHRFAEEA